MMDPRLRLSRRQALKAGIAAVGIAAGQRRALAMAADSGSGAPAVTKAISLGWARVEISKTLRPPRGFSSPR